MAKIGFDGLSALSEALERETERIARNGEAAVTAGATVAQSRMKESAPVRSEAVKSGHKGHLRDHIKVGKANYTRADGWHVDVYPDGKRDDGQRYAAVGYILEYGRSNAPAHPWMVPTMEQHGAEINEAMRKELFKD